MIHICAIDNEYRMAQIIVLTEAKEQLVLNYSRQQMKVKLSK